MPLVYTLVHTTTPRPRPRFRTETERTRRKQHDLDVASRYVDYLKDGNVIQELDGVRFSGVTYTGRNIKPFPLHPDFWMVPEIIGEKSQTYYDRDTGTFKKGWVFKWNPVQLGKTGTDYMFIQGTYLKVAGGKITLILNNILNRYPTKSVLWVLVRVLRSMRELGIIKIEEPPHGQPNPRSLLMMYKIVREFFFTPVFDVRMDFVVNNNMVENSRFPFWVHARSLATSNGTNTKMHTLYFTHKNANTRMYLYSYPGYYRFEMVIPKKVTLAYATSDKIIEQLKPRQILRHRNHRGVRHLLTQVLQKPVLTIAETELANEGESLFRLSNPLNQYFKKRL